MGTEEEPQFTGACPNCELETSFVRIKIAAVLQACYKTIIGVWDRPWKSVEALFKWLDREDGAVGRCVECDANVIQCPKCDAINSNAEMDGLFDCDSCSKKFSMP